MAALLLGFELLLRNSKIHGDCVKLNGPAMQEIRLVGSAADEE
jgi:hypothetical protein